MSKKPKDITLALSLLGRGDYSKVIRLLESKIPLYVENREFYTILAKAFFYTGDYSGAKLYFDRGQKIYWHIETALFLAVLGLKRRDFNSALRIWLDILDEDPNNKLAKKGLSTLKKYSTMDELDYFIHSKKIDSLIPRKKIKFSLHTKVIACGIIIIFISSFTIYKTGLYNNIISKIKSSTSIDEVKREGVNDFNINNMSMNVDLNKESIFSFTGEQIEEYFSIASNLFQDNRDNRVKSYLNLIKYSNANENIKQRAELLESYLKEPDWSGYDDDIHFSEVSENIYKYEGCIVKWKGKLSNLDIINKKIHFTLLVGYDSGKVLEGLVPVELNENVKIQENQPIEVLGRIILKENNFYLEALTVMQYIIRD